MTSDLRERLSAMGLEPKKAFGQNFLVSPQVIGKIVSAVRAENPEHLVEIGPGLGALTEPLLAANLEPLLLELDPQLVEYWSSRGLKVLAGDALRLDWNTLALPTPTLLVSNLPYQISSSLVIERCSGPSAIRVMILMFQKEVAEKIQAQPRTKDYGLLSVLAQLHFEIRKVCDASPQDFHPAPKVASRVLHFRRRADVDLGPKFLRFVKQAFAFRRKYVIKNLKGLLNPDQLAGLVDHFAALGLSPQARAEELAPAQFTELFKRLYEH